MAVRRGRGARIRSAQDYPRSGLPPENSFGGAAVQLRPFPNPSKSGAAQPISLSLIEHEKSGLQDIDVMSTDVNGSEQIAAGNTRKYAAAHAAR